jgi:hypothetical protein
VLCTVFVVSKNLNTKDSPGQNSKRFHEFICRLDMDGGVDIDSPLVFTFPKDKFYPGLFGLWLYISHARFREHLDVRGCISPQVTTNSPDVQIKLCGARLLYEEDMVEFVQTLSQERFGNPDDLRQSHEEFIDSHMNFSNGQSDSIPRLKRELMTLLSTLYQVSPFTENHNFCIYFFLTEHHLCISVFYRETLHETTGTIISFLMFRFPDGSVIKIVCPT